MKTLLLIFLTSASALKASAQNYSIDWHTIAGGGGTSTGSGYFVNCTLGSTTRAG